MPSTVMSMLCFGNLVRDTLRYLHERTFVFDPAYTIVNRIFFWGREIVRFPSVHTNTKRPALPTCSAHHFMNQSVLAE